MHRKGGIEKHLSPAQADHLHQLLPCSGAAPATAQPGVSEGPQPHVGHHAGPAPGDGAEEVGDHPLRSAVGFDFVVEDHLAYAG